LELARHNHAIAEGREDDHSDTWGLLCDAGGDARVNGIPFSEERTAPWKEGWSETDISLGVHGLEGQWRRACREHSLVGAGMREDLLALGLCATCYMLKRQD
jgi:hypothetical protein